MFLLLYVMHFLETVFVTFIASSNRRLCV